MKLIIDIPEEDYNFVKKQVADGITNPLKMRIADGTPLPTVYVRLIDYGYVVDAIDDWINAEEYRYTNATDYLRKRIKNVPTIIEADTESEDKE